MSTVRYYLKRKSDQSTQVNLERGDQKPEETTASYPSEINGFRHISIEMQNIIDKKDQPEAWPAPHTYVPSNNNRLSINYNASSIVIAYLFNTIPYYKPSEDKPYFSLEHAAQFTYLKILCEAKDAKIDAGQPTLNSLHQGFVGYTPPRNGFFSKPTEGTLGIAQKALTYLNKSRFASWQHHNNPSERQFWEMDIPDLYYRCKANEKLEQKNPMQPLNKALQEKQRYIIEESLKKGSSLFGDYAKAIVSARIIVNGYHGHNEIKSHASTSHSIDNYLSHLMSLLEPLIDYSKPRMLLDKRTKNNVDCTQAMLTNIIESVISLALEGKDPFADSYKAQTALIKQVAQKITKGGGCARAFDAVLKNIERHNKKSAQKKLS